MPTNGYQDYSTQIPASYGSLTNNSLLHAHLIDLGQNTTTLSVDQFWIDGSQGYPVLMLSSYSSLNDQLLTQQALAPGVVSVQLLFGVVPLGSTVGAAQPTWKTWGSISPSDQIVAADLAVVMRTLHPDPNYSAPSKVVVPNPSQGLSAPNAFVDYIPQPSEAHEHFAVFTREVALRNLIWGGND
jgi:type IV pilus assembly protein PilW